MSLRSERKLTEINRYFFFSQNGQFPHFRLQSVPGDEHDVKFPDFLFQNSAAARAADDGIVGGSDRDRPGFPPAGLPGNQRRSVIFTGSAADSLDDPRLCLRRTGLAGGDAGLQLLFYRALLVVVRR